MKKIGAFEAKTHLSEILEEVKNGEEVTVTKRGKPVARIIPFKVKPDIAVRKEIFKRCEIIRKKVKGKVNIRKLIEEGRKY